MDIELVLRNSGSLLDGAKVTLAIALVGATIALTFGSAICALRISRSAVFRAFARAYILFFRITPEVIMIFWAYYCIPLIFDANVSGFWAGSVVLGLIGAAFLAEIFRAGIEAVPRGQKEAAESLGLKAFPKWAVVILPQAFRFVIAPLVNYFSEFLKNTTLLSAIGVMDLSLQAYLLGGRTYQYITFLSVIAIIYFAMIFPVTLYARQLERRLGSQGARSRPARASFFSLLKVPREAT
ncbi:His/Glu/Gln/Arg/opine family amino acid ABC transporter permease subunit [Mycoplana sp. BE70]|uniref:amino acid ABC transporter permease n=1 Tax=Mycoplana sp. BE70 TaxID=2817775 RepID=UPI002862FAD4|nr:amino acid ABC transporter permease [Mycoplana sp. BE70]MDR6755139.1 His/Glu/Gln/Arg/opine family amino acid ABC transporter permease subunit [Mycoplana sp. BE70]